MANIPWEVPAHYIANFIWLCLAIYGFRTGRWKPWVVLGTVILFVMNLRFFTHGFAYGLSHTTAITDIILQAIYSEPGNLSGTATCPDNRCSLMGEAYPYHTSWAIMFYDRFVYGPTSTQFFLYTHIAGNTLAFLLVTYQLYKPAYSPIPAPPREITAVVKRNQLHRLLGKLSFVAMCVGVIFGALLAEQHDSILEYGGAWSKWGLWEMSACVFATGAMGVYAIRQGDVARHRIWMWRHAGSLWGSFFAFRIIIAVTDPIFIQQQGVAWNLAAWLGAPVGILFAEAARRHLDQLHAKATLNGTGGTLSTH